MLSVPLATPKAPTTGASQSDVAQPPVTEADEEEYDNAYDNAESENFDLHACVVYFEKGGYRRTEKLREGLQSKHLNKAVRFDI